MTTKCVIYRRFSSDEQGKGQGDTLVTQLAACEAYAARKGWQVAEVLTDEGFSAFKGEHLKPPAALAKFVDRVYAGEIEQGTVLLAYKQNRLSRRPTDEMMVWIYGLTSRGIGIAVTDTETVYEANPTVEAFIGKVIQGGLANKESADKSDLVRKARQRMWTKAENREGKWTHIAARPPLWLIRHPDRWEINEPRADIIRQVYQWSADGLGVVKITSRLNTMGEQPWGLWHRSDGKSWCRTSVRQLLSNPAVEGDLVPVTGMFLGRKIIGFYPRIVDADVVAQSRANQRQRSSGLGRLAPTGNANLFSTVCGQCGHRAHLSSSISKGKRYAYIRCEGANEGRCSNNSYYAYEKFEQTAMAICLDLALDDRFFEATGEFREARKRHAEIVKAIGEKRRVKKHWMGEQERSIIQAGRADPDVADQIEKMRFEIDELTAAFEQAKADIDRASGQVGAVEHLRRVNDIRAAALSEDRSIREQARAKLRTAFNAIINSVAIEPAGNGQRVFTVAFLGGVLAVRIDTEGRVVKAISDIGMPTVPLWSVVGDRDNEALKPLIHRIKTLAA